VKVKECRDDIVLEPHHVYSTLLCLVYFIQNIKKKEKKKRDSAHSVHRSILHILICPAYYPANYLSWANSLGAAHCEAQCTMWKNSSTQSSLGSSPPSNFPLTLFEHSS